MSKILSIVFIVTALVLIVYNTTMLDFKNPLEGNSIIALIGILASLCAIVLLLIFIISKKIQKKVNEN